MKHLNPPPFALGRLFVLVVLATFLATTVPAQTLGTAFVYQGALRESGAPVNGTRDLTFRLFDASSGGNQVGSDIAMTGVAVSDGLFSVSLDFGDQYDGNARWLEIEVGGSILTPRQELTPTPHALYAASAGSAPGDNLGDHTATTDLLLAGNDITSTGDINVVSGGGQIFIGGNDRFIAGAASNTAAGAQAASLGGNTNAANGDRSVALGGNGNTAGGNNSFMGAGLNNAASGLLSATVGGEGLTANGLRSAAMGGNGNTAGAINSIVLGGFANATSGGGNSIIAGGINNQATNQRSAALGGNGNIVSGVEAAAVGGIGNQAGGAQAIVLGGASNEADGLNSLAAGQDAHADHANAFVWSDGSSAPFASTAADQFLIEASNGVGINKNNPATALDVNGTVTATAFAGDGSALTGINVDDADADPTNELQDLASVLSRGNDAGGADISNAGTVTATAFAGDGSALTGISGDNLGSHAATQALDMATFNINNAGAVTAADLTVDGTTLFVDEVNNRVGIGTTTPRRALEVLGDVILVERAAASGMLIRNTQDGIMQAGIFVENAGATGEGWLNLSDQDGTRVLYLRNDKAGILNTNPSTALDVTGTVTATAFAGDGSALTGININDADADPANEIQTISASGSQVSLSSGGGSARVSSLAASDNNPTDAVFVDASGNVGINETAPSSTLDVVGTFASGTNSNSATGGQAAVVGGSANAASAASAVVVGGARNAASAANATVMGGLDNLASGSRASVIGGGDNMATNTDTAIIGGSNNVANANFAVIYGGFTNTCSAQDAVVVGGEGNDSLGTRAGVVAGINNTASSTNSFIGGGSGVSARGANAAVIGGRGSVAEGWGSVILGGMDNTVLGDSNSKREEPTSSAEVGKDGLAQRVKTVDDLAPGSPRGAGAVILGGEGNIAEGKNSVILGGERNAASGRNSLAMGRNAKALHEGSLVWASGLEEGEFASSRPGEFAAQALGGAVFATAPPMDGKRAGSGIRLNPGEGAWTALCDRDSKENFAPVDSREVLERVAAMPIATWNWKAQDSRVKHLGPTAQDFSAAFGLGADDKGITTIDADGVALAAIQGLYEVLQEKDARIEKLESEKEELESRLARLEALVETLASPSDNN